MSSAWLEGRQKRPELLDGSLQKLVWLQLRFSASAFPVYLRDFSRRETQDVPVTARSPNAWWLLPGAVALVAVTVLDLRGGQLLSVVADVGTGSAFYVAGGVAYLARPANRSAWLLLGTATALALGKAIGSALSVAAVSSPEVAHSWLAAELINAAGWALLTVGVALFVSFPDGAYQRSYERWLVRLLPVAFVPLLLLHLLGSRHVT